MDFEKINTRDVIIRVVTAYDLKNAADLGRLFNVSSSTIANRISRNLFPADYVVQCAIETGVSVKWLTTGEGPMKEGTAHENEESGSRIIDKLSLINGELSPSGTLSLDKSLLPTQAKHLQAIASDGDTYVADREITDLSDGKWLIDIDGKISIRDIALIPGKQIHVTGGSIPFQCSLDEIKGLGRVIGVYKDMI